MKNQIIADIRIFKHGPDEAPSAVSLVLFRPEGDHNVCTTINVQPEKMEEIVKFFEDKPSAWRERARELITLWRQKFVALLQ